MNLAKYPFTCVSSPYTTFTELDKACLSIPKTNIIFFTENKCLTLSRSLIAKSGLHLSNSSTNIIIGFPVTFTVSCDIFSNSLLNFLIEYLAFL